MNFFRKMVNRDYDIKLDIPFSEFRKNPIKYSMDVRSKPKDLFVVKFKDCTKVYKICGEHMACKQCPLSIAGDDSLPGVYLPEVCGLVHRLEYNMIINACTHVGVTKQAHPCGFVSLDEVMEDL